MSNLVSLWQLVKNSFKENTKEEKPGGETGIENVLKSYDKAYNKLEKATGVERAQAVQVYTEAAETANRKLSSYLNKLRQLSKRGDKDEKKYDLNVVHLIQGVEELLDHIRQNLQDLQLN